MALRQTQVMVELERTAGRALGKAAKQYRRRMIVLLLAGIRKAKSAEGLLRELGPGLVRKMDAAPVAEAMNDASATATGVGMVSALPKETSKRRNVKTSETALAPSIAITKSDFTPRTAEDAARHFGRKVALPSEAFDRLTAEAKTRAFRMAGVHKVRVVQGARDIVHKGIREGTPFPEIRRELLAIFDTLGIPRPALYRLRFMFQQNTQQAYNDARREALDDPEMARAFPFRQYLTVGNGTAGVRGVRPEHAALHGKVFRWNDPFWDSHTPPWDWGCRCFFRSLTAGQAKRLGVKVIDLGYVRKRIRVAGQGRRGIKANAQFMRGKIDTSKVDAELRRVLEEMAG